MLLYRRGHAGTLLWKLAVLYVWRAPCWFLARLGGIGAWGATQAYASALREAVTRQAWQQVLPLALQLLPCLPDTFGVLGGWRANLTVTGPTSQATEGGLPVSAWDWLTAALMGAGMAARTRQQWLN